jgi:hypothetical protein
MLIQRVNRTDAEKIFIAVKNVEDTSITTGQGAVFCNAVNGAAAGVSADGIQVLRATTTANMVSFAGVASQDIVTEGVGLVQCWGVNTSVMFSHRASNTTVGAGLIAEIGLIPSATLAGAFTSTSPQDTAVSTYLAAPDKFPMIVMDTVVTSLSAHSAIGVYGTAFIRAI